MNKSNIYKSITIIEDQQKVYKYLIFVLHLISKIASNHHRQNDFSQKLKKIIRFFKTYRCGDRK